MPRPLRTALVCTVAGVAAAYLLSARLVRSLVTSAGASRRLIAVTGSTGADGKEWLEFDGHSFAAHPGQLSMRAASGGELLRLGEPRCSGTSVRRPVLHGDGSAVLRQGKGRLSGHLGETPSAFGFAYETVDVAGRPAWLIQGGSARDVWVIHVHGLGSSRSQCLRGLRAFADLGFTSLVPSYRTSLDGAVKPPRSHLGVSEYRDIEAAYRYALDSGATGVIFVGWSLGASIVLRTLEQAGTGSVLGALLVSPALDWPAIITAQLRRLGIPGWLGRSLLSGFNGVRFPGEPFIRWRDMPGTYMQGYASVPTMIFHGSDDASVPVELSRVFAAMHRAPVRFVEFEGAHHTLEWNAAPELWTDSVQDWCRSIGLDTENHLYTPILEAK